MPGRPQAQTTQGAISRRPYTFTCFYHVPKAMSHDIEATYWGDQVHNIHDHSKETLQAIGLATTNQGRIIASCKNQEVKDCLKQHDLHDKHLNARQCFELIKANKEPPHIALPFRCHREPPEDINVYTDGGWVHLEGIQMSTKGSAKLRKTLPTASSNLMASCCTPNWGIHWQLHEDRARRGHHSPCCQWPHPHRH